MFTQKVPFSRTMPSCGCIRWDIHPKSLYGDSQSRYHGIKCAHCPLNLFNWILPFLLMRNKAGLCSPRNQSSHEFTNKCSKKGCHFQLTAEVEHQPKKSAWFKSTPQTCQGLRTAARIPWSQSPPCPMASPTPAVSELAKNVDQARINFGSACTCS